MQRERERENNLKFPDDISARGVFDSSSNTARYREIIYTD